MHLESKFLEQSKNVLLPRSLVHLVLLNRIKVVLLVVVVTLLPVILSMMLIWVMLILALLVESAVVMFSKRTRHAICGSSCRADDEVASPWTPRNLVHDPLILVVVLRISQLGFVFKDSGIFDQWEFLVTAGTVARTARRWLANVRLIRWWRTRVISEWKIIDFR